MSISRRNFTKFGLATIAAGSKIITSQTDATAFPAVAPQKEWDGLRRAGLRPNGVGAYWGGGAEQIDMLSGNLNYSLPLFIAGGRGVNVRFLCSYNSQLWEHDNPDVIAYGIDTGVGYGWRIQLGSIVPQYSNGSIAGYTFISDNGAEFPLSLSRGVWISQQGLFNYYAPSERKLQFSDGTFWVMGCTSASSEADAGTLHPTVIQDKNGNQIVLRYTYGAGSQHDNTSSRILEIVDSRAADTDSGRKSYTFEYDDGATPHLLSITSHVDAKENCYFTGEIQQVVSSFGGNGNKAYDFMRVLKSFRNEGQPPQVFEYNQHGEMEQAQLPYGARFRWWYETINNEARIRSVNRRGLTLSHGKKEAIWEISIGQNNGKDARRVTTLTDSSGGAKRVWSFDADPESEGCGLLSILEEKENSRTFRFTSYLWKSTIAGVPYIGTIVTALDPGTPEESTCKEEFERDIFGNLTENRKYDFGNPFQPIRVISNTYLTDPEYIDRGICDLLLTSTIGDGKESVEQIRNLYDTTTVADLQNISEHDFLYGTGRTIRGNLTESLIGGVYNRINYDITGAVDSIEDGVGNRTDFSEDKQESNIRHRKIIPDSEALLGSQTFIHLNFKPKVLMQLSGKTKFETDRLIMHEGDALYSVVKSANKVTKTTTDGVYKTYVYDDFERLYLVEKGGRKGVESIINYEWGYAPNAPLGACLRASLPHAPNAEPEWVTYNQDSLGRPTKQDKLSHGGEESFLYKGNAVTTVNARDGWKKLSIDPIGKIRKVTVGDPQEGSVTETNYQYNHRGRLNEATLPRNEGTQKHTFSYNDAGRLVADNRAESGYEERTYNADGTLASKTDARGQRTAYGYDSKKRLTSVKCFDDDGQLRPEQCVKLYYDINPFEVLFSKNPEGRLTAAQWGDENILPGLITELYSYTHYGLLAAKRMRINRGGGRSVDIDLYYVHSSEGRITEISYTGGQPLTYEYDSMGRQVRLASETDVLVKDAVYTPAGLLASYQQLIPYTQEYITETRTINSQCQTHRILVEQAGNILVDVEYEYSKQDGRLVADKDRIAGDRTSYGYDSIGRLITAKNTDKDWETGFEHDGFGSLTKKNQKKGRGRSFEAKHNPKTNRIQEDQVEYDANGNIINHYGIKLSFDIKNRLIEARNVGMEVEKYAYNKDDLRIWKQYSNGREEFYLYGSDNKPIATYRLMGNKSGEISLLLTDNNIYFAKKLIRTQNEAVVVDRIGHVKAGNSRNTNKKVKYAPFGEEETITGENQIKYGTYMRDGMTGLDYARHRYYSSVLGRFISPDPYVKCIRLDNPDSWNRYTYVENDPINNIDPNGTYCRAGYDDWCSEYSCPAFVIDPLWFYFHGTYMPGWCDEECYDDYYDYGWGYDYDYVPYIDPGNSGSEDPGVPGSGSDTGNSESGGSSNPIAPSNVVMGFIADYESFSAMPYIGQDSQNRTVGYGHVITEADGTMYDNGITQEDALALLMSDAAGFTNSLNTFLVNNEISLNQNEYDALLSFTYNTGNGWMSDSTLRTNLVNGESCNVGDAMSMWIYAGGQVSQGLVNRRADEVAIFYDADYNRDY